MKIEIIIKVDCKPVAIPIKDTRPLVDRFDDAFKRKPLDERVE